MTVIPKASCGNAIIWIDKNGNKLCYVLFSDLVISQHCLTANNYHNGRCYTRSIMCHQATMGIIIHIYINSRYIVFAYSTVMLYGNQNERKGAIFLSINSQRHPMPRPYGWAMSRHFWVLWRKYTSRCRECTLYHTVQLHMKLNTYRYEMRVCPSVYLWLLLKGFRPVGLVSCHRWSFIPSNVHKIHDRNRNKATVKSLI